MTASARSALVTLIVAAILGLLAVIASVVFSAVMAGACCAGWPTCASRR